MPLQNVDIPLSGQDVYPVGIAKADMRIADELIKSVGFVSRLDPDPASSGHIVSPPGGTAFIVGAQGLAHLVTARHVAEAIEPAEAVIAMNGKDGLPLFLRTGNQGWFYHPTEKDSVDVAVIPFGSTRFSEYDISWIPEEIFATNQRISEFDVGLGDEFVVIGLFTRFFGSSKLTPIVRTGNIAMMPKDKVPIKDFGLMEVYLAEGRSIGGLSGSPVFVRNTVNMPVTTANGERGRISGLGSLHLLGLMHGHWDLPLSFKLNQQEAEAVNMGVSIIVPAKKILETLYHPELVAMRKEHLENEKKQSPTADSSFPKVFTKDDFDAALKKASRKRSDEK
jgi:hypothetical protein